MAHTEEHRWAGLLWTAVPSAAFVVSLLVLAPLHMSLSWDETVYASQISQHVPIMRWQAERSRGMPIILAPVTLLTGSVLALRLYLTVLAGVGLFVGLLAWRRLSNPKVLALAAVVFAALGVTQYESWLAFPNFWMALAALAIVGLFLQVAAGGRATVGILVALGCAAAVGCLLRPADSAFICGPLYVVAAVAVARRRDTRRRFLLALAAITAGLAVGYGEWLAEAYLYFGGPLERLRGARADVGGTHFDPLNSLRVLGGGPVSSLPRFPGIHGWNYPQFLPWWAVFVALAVLGTWVAARRRGWLLALVPLVCALTEYVGYSLPVRDNARYLLPAWALLAVPAAEGAVWLVTSRQGKLRYVAAATVVLFVGFEFASQHLVALHQEHHLEAAARTEDDAVIDLEKLRVRPPCVVYTTPRLYSSSLSLPIAYYLDCAFVLYSDQSSPQGERSARHVMLVVHNGPATGVARLWPEYDLPGTDGTSAYIQPQRRRHSVRR